MNTKITTFLVLFGLFWSALTLLFDGLVFVPAARQVMAENYPSTEGTILSSEVTQHDGSEGDTVHGVLLRFTYSVNDHEYTGTRYRYDTSSSSDSAWAYRVVAARPPGTKVQVFYNPNDPQNSVLATGLLGSDLFMFDFMTPFNAVMLGFWWAGCGRLRRKWFKPIAGGVKIVTKLKITRVRLTFWSPIRIMLATTALLTFCSMFVVAFFCGGFHPTMKTMRVTWSLILCGALLAGAWHALK